MKKTKIGLSFYMLKVAVPDERKKKLNYFKMNNINSLDISNIIYDFLHNKSVDFENEREWIVDETMFWILRTYIRLRHRSFAEKVVHDV